MVLFWSIAGTSAVQQLQPNADNLTLLCQTRHDTLTLKITELENELNHFKSDKGERLHNVLIKYYYCKNSYYFQGSRPIVFLFFCF